MKLKLSFFSLLLFILLSCASKKYNNDLFKVFDKKEYDDYTLYYGNKNDDTIVFVGENKFIENCKSSFKSIDRSGLKTISTLKTTKHDIIFCYFLSDVNGHLSILTGTGTPGQSDKTYITTYSEYPYFINNCNALR
ncbi:MAG: hypothetical protein BM557_03185 [Flavobacterium sp. MedPE-SWcel]|uniref:hypothetical protein n=1 Tax=uncultured Flavobacterium sp. TaxID=165435 RepID=UPI000917B678|nr:hypothetical protein [uncultured Flavobacterium sp.]OIQ21811.1 MAG: hypothetical protein BM557_03185 [Flavobacterium sp. MedPE-SWcel]